MAKPVPVGAYQLNLDGSAAPGAQALGHSVPSGANFVLFFFGATDDNSLTLSNFATNFTSTPTIFAYAADGGAFGVWCVAAPITSTGAGKTFTPTWNTGVPYGPSGAVVYLTVDNPSDVVRAVNAIKEWGGLTQSVTSETTDLVLACQINYGSTAPALQSGSTNVIVTTDNRDSTLRVHERPAASPTTSATMQNPSYSSLLLISLKDGGGGGSAPTITTQPANQTVTEGSAANYSVVATGATSYQWLRNRNVAQSIISVTTQTLGTAQNPSATSITVPADATAVVVLGAYASTTGAAVMNSMAANFVSGGNLTLTTATQTAFAGGGVVGRGAVSATGARTYTPAFNRSIEAGGVLHFVWLKDVNPADLVTTPVLAQTSNGSAAAAAVVSSPTGAVVLALDTRSGTTPPDESGWTSLDTGTVNIAGQLSTRLRRANTPGTPNTTATSQGTNGSVISAVAIKLEGPLAVTDGAGGTTANYTTPLTTAAMNGYSYLCDVSNAYGTTRSSAALLSVTSGGDTTPPTLTSPTASATGSTTGTGSVQTNEANGVMYCIVSTNSAKPTVTQIQAGQQNGGTAAPFADSKAISVTGPQSFPSTSLLPSTTYYYHFQHQDAAGNNSTVETSPAFTTSAPAGTPPTVDVTGQTVSGQNVTVVGTYTGTVTSATITLPAADPANGAVTVGPIPVPYSGGTFSVTMTAVSPGSYGAPVVTMTNADGSGTDSGSPLEILGIDGTPTAPTEVVQTEAGVFADAPTRSIAATVAQSENLAATDAPTSAKGIAASQAENLAATDAPTRTIAATQAQAENLASTDAPTSSISATSAQAETLGATDAPSAGGALVVSQGDAMNGADSSVAAVDTTFVQQAESMNGADSQASAASATGAQAENLAATDAPTRTISATSAQVENMGTVESWTAAKDMLAAQAESMNGIDTYQGYAITGVFTLELAQIVGTITGDVSIIAGDQVEGLVVTDAQFAALVKNGLIQEAATPVDVSTALVLTGTTVYESMDVRDVTALLRYPIPTRPSPYVVRRWRIRYR